MRYVLFLTVMVILSGCGSADIKPDKTAAKGGINGDAKTTQEQLNITILLDLSDRIDPQKNPEKPEHYLRDIATVQYFSQLFVNDMEKRNAYMAKGKLKIIVSPKPSDPNINIIAEKLSVNLAGMSNAQKKETHDQLVETFRKNIESIYNTTLTQKNWLGSDIWRFFKNDVKDYCVETTKEYRNILVILTDGYIYHPDSKDKLNNRFAYLLPENITKYNLRKAVNIDEEIKKTDFGLITKRNDLQNLEVLVLGVSPSKSYKNDEDIIKSVLSKWFEEMKVKRYAIYNTDLPEYTKQRINDFMK